MIRLARILLVEPEDELRQDLNWHLEKAGHEVASVSDAGGASRLVEEGLSPDIVVADAAASANETELRTLCPSAAYLRIVHDAEEAGSSSASNEFADDPTICGPDPKKILHRIEEVLLDHEPGLGEDEAMRCLDLARRLGDALPKKHETKERIELITEGFDRVFGVKGTLVIRRGPEPDEWIEVLQGMDREVAACVGREVGRRTQSRGLRPFMRTFDVDGESHSVACLAVQLGDVETDLALELERAPSDAAMRETLMNLVGNAMRASAAQEKLAETRSVLEAQVTSTERLLTMSHEFANVGHRNDLGAAILRAIHRDLGMSRSALFRPRDEGSGMLDLQATLGFQAAALDRIGLSCFHGVGAEALRVAGARRLSSYGTDGAASRELRLLSEAGLDWAVVASQKERPLGVVFFGSPHEPGNLTGVDHQILHAVLEAASVALRNLERVEGLQQLAISTLKAIVAAVEVDSPDAKGHSERVARHAVRVGHAIGLNATEILNLALAALLHDVGRVGMRGPRKRAVTARDRSSRVLPVISSGILSQAKPPAGVIQAVEQHGERWDGQGAPYGLRGSDIHLYARILAIANAYDRMCCPKHGDLDPESALRRLERGAGLVWDAGLVATFSAEVGRGPGASGSGDYVWLEEVLSAI